jgi:hypothetical protein
MDGCMDMYRCEDKRQQGERNTNMKGGYDTSRHHIKGKKQTVLSTTELFYFNVVFYLF